MLLNRRTRPSWRGAPAGTCGSAAPPPCCRTSERLDLVPRPRTCPTCREDRRRGPGSWCRNKWPPRCECSTCYQSAAQPKSYVAGEARLKARRSLARANSASIWASSARGRTLARIGQNCQRYGRCEFFGIRLLEGGRNVPAHVLDPVLTAFTEVFCDCFHVCHF